MDKITISSKMDSTFGFEMTARGINLKDARALFQTEISKGITYDILCDHIKGDKWSVTIPKGLINDGAYDFKLCVIIEDFYFEPVKGKLNVISEHIIKVFGVSEEKQEEKQEPTKNEDVKSIVKRLKERQKESNEEITVEELPDLLNEEIEDLEEQIEETIDIEDLDGQVKVEEIEVTLTPAVIAENSLIRDFKRRDDINKRVKLILDNISNASSSEEKLSEDEKLEPALPEVTIGITETQEPGPFFEEIDKMRELNERRKKNRAIKDAIRSIRDKS